MNDNQTKVSELKALAAHFVAERDWLQFHSPKNLSMNIACEASELMEKFLWVNSEQSGKELLDNRQEIENELADLLFGVLCFANVANIDLAGAFEHKLQEIAKKYPIDKAKGRREKYTKL